MNVLVRLPEFFRGEIQLADLIKTWEEFYGKDFHYSALVIYGLCFYYLSKHYEKYGIVGSRNVAYSAAWTWLSIGIFELYWMASYSYFQGQPWVLKLQFPQLRIIIQNIIGMFTAGGLTVLYCYVDSCVLNKKGDVVGRLWRFNWNKITWFLVAASIISAVFWWFYPGYVERFSVTYETGETWTNSDRFPQTLYTIDVNPQDSINAGVWYWKENDLVHGWNTLVKVLFTLCLFNIGRVKFAGRIKFEMA